MNNQTIFTKTALLAILSILSLQVNAKEYQATLNFKNGLSFEIQDAETAPPIAMQYDWYAADDKSQNGIGYSLSAGGFGRTEGMEYCSFIKTLKKTSDSFSAVQVCIEGDGPGSLSDKYTQKNTQLIMDAYKNNKSKVKVYTSQEGEKARLNEVNVNRISFKLIGNLLYVVETPGERYTLVKWREKPVSIAVKR